MTGDHAEVSSLSRRASLTRIRPITGRHWLSPRSCTRTPIGSPYGSLSQEGRDTGLPRSTYIPEWVRLCLYAGDRCVCDRTETRALLLVTYLLVQAFCLAAQHPRLVIRYGASTDSSHLLAIPSTRPPSHRCWRLQPPLTVWLLTLEGDLVPEASHRRITPAACSGRVRGQNPRLRSDYSATTAACATFVSHEPKKVQSFRQVNNRGFFW